MKPKPSLIVGILLACLAIVLGISTVAKNGDGMRKTDAAYNPAVDASPRNRASSPRRPVSTPLSDIETARAFSARLDEVMLIQDPALRLAAIRKRLGMDISNALYQKSLAAYGYQNNSQRLLEIIGKLWMYDDPAAATAWAHRLQAAGATEPRTCVGNSAVFVGCLREDFTIDALAQWMHADRSRAMAWAKAQGIDPEVMERADANSAAINEKLRPKPAGEIVAELMRLEQRAITLQGTTSTQEIRAMIKEEFTRLADTDLAAAIEFLNTTMVDSPSLRPFLNVGMEVWAKLDPDGALLAAKDMQDSNQRAYALCHVILPAWQLKYPDRNIAEIIDLDTLGRYVDSLNNMLVKDLALSNPSYALKYAMEIEDSATSDGMVIRIIESWARVSPTEAIKAIAELPGGSLRDRATGQVAREISMADFQQASLLVDQIANDAQRHKAINDILSWSRILQGSEIKGSSIQDAIVMLDRLPSIRSYNAKDWARDISQQDISAFRAWLVQAYDSGQLSHERIPGESATDAELEARRESNYQEAIGTLDKRLKEKP